jgi:hypothetical protein
LEKFLIFNSSQDGKDDAFPLQVAGRNRLAMSLGEAAVSSGS